MSTTTDTTSQPHHSPHTPVGRVAGMALGLAVLVALVVLAFSWPAVTAEPHDVPVAIAGPEEAVLAVQPMIQEQAGDLLELTVVADRDAAIDAIQTREVVGAVVLGPQPELLTASAAGATAQVVARLAEPLQAALAAQAQQIAEQTGQPADEATLTVTDVVPYAADDAAGLGMTAAFFPLLLGGMLGGIALSVAVVGSMRRIAGVVIYAVVGGVTLTAILQTWFGSIQGDFWTNAAAFSLSLAAIAAPIVGFVAIFGRPGIAVGPVVMMLFANPISGAGVPASYLPGAWGKIGQWFPPGASATVVRSLSYFPAADTAFSWLVLAGWTVAGLLLAVVGHYRTAGGTEPNDSPRRRTSTASGRPARNESVG